jgi:hypothetical protein
MTEQGPIEPFSKPGTNRTKLGFTEKKEGFSAGLPNVGTITHEFSFITDPWQIVSVEGPILFELSQIKLTISKVFNINNSTDSYYTISWNPNYFHRSRYTDEPLVSVPLFDSDGALLDGGNLGNLGAICGWTDRQSKKKIINPLYFDRIQGAAFVIGASTWYKC